MPSNAEHETEARGHSLDRVRLLAGRCRIRRVKPKTARPLVRDGQQCVFGGGLPRLVRGEQQDEAEQDAQNAGRRDPGDRRSGQGSQGRRHFQQDADTDIREPFADVGSRRA